MDGSEGETIFARATGAGAAPIAIIRVSGPRAHACLAALISGDPPPPHRLSLRRLSDPDTGEALDQAMVVRFDPPNTATGEAVAEFHVHGGRAVIVTVCQALARCGARPAAPGEFSRRALASGRADLTKLEATAALIEAESRAQQRAAVRMLTGALSDRIATWRRQVIHMRMLLDASLDFSDQDLPDHLTEAVARPAQALAAELRAVAQDARRTETLQQGHEVALVGLPNTGKSSLLNRLAARDVALTSAIPGTTRDVIEARCMVGEHVVTFLDTAGRRDAVDAVEQAGVAWGVQRAAASALVVGLCSPDAPEQPVDADILAWNKADLAQPPDGFEGLAVSALTGEGVSALMNRIAEALTGASREPAIGVTARQAACLGVAAIALDAAATVEVDLAAEELRIASEALESILGVVGVEAVLDEIFAGFCIGK